MVCFTMEESRLLDDTLWARLDQRQRREILWKMIQNRNEAVQSANNDLGRCNDALRVKTLSEGALRTERDNARSEALDWQLKAKGRGGRGLMIGIGLGALLGYGVSVAVQ